MPASPAAPAFSAAPPSSDTPEQSVPEAPAAPSATAASEPALAAQAAPLPEPEPAAASAPPSPPVASAPEEAQGSQAAAGPSPAPPLSLLERAAAERQQRRQQILEAAAAAGAEPAAAAPVIPAPGMAPAVVPPPAVAEPAASAADQAEPSLGAFDADFTWSAEVLAAQGRRVEDVSLEEIDWLTRLRRGLEKTRRGLVAQLLDTLGDDPLSADSLDDIESSLLRADVGVQATDQVLEALRRRLNEEVVDPAEGLRFLKEQLRGILEEPIRGSGRELLAPERGRLNVWLMVGVNGVGKTTTLGKLANLAVRSGYSCLIAAADTFRAAAVQQVSVWGERSGVPVVSNPSANADPAAVVFDAIGAAKAKGTELVLVDTAGRLQTKHNLMEELSKVRRIVDKLAPEAVVESLLVLDASQGQNGLRQAMAFASAAGLTGVVITKLDGSARG
ncbi:MAG: signal recognition particle-docking protein FtsY, partial [Cyanobium sp.]